MASETSSENETTLSTQQTTLTTQSTLVVKFCNVCGATMYQGEIYGFEAWICPQGDSFEFID